MRTAIAWLIGIAAVLHGAIHLVVAASGFGWAGPALFRSTTDSTMSAMWLAVGALTVVVGVVAPRRATGWWGAAGVAAVLSQVLIITNWHDTWVGTAPNVLLMLAALWGYRADGPGSLRVEYRRAVAAAEGTLATRRGDDGGVVTDADVDPLPPPVAAWVRASGAVGRPHVLGFEATITGRIRSGPEAPWMSFEGAQVNTFGDMPSRVFLLDATMKGLPADVLHSYVAAAARMRVRAGSVLPVVDVSGAELTRAETVTLLNDLVVFAPGAVVDAPITWEVVGDQHVKATYRCGDHTVSATLVFDDEHQLVDFVSDDRSALSADGRTLTVQRWSTPISEHRDFAGRRAGAAGTGRWHPVDSPAFDYLEIAVRDLSWLE